MSRTFLPHVITDDSALGGSVIERSLRFNDDDSAYLERNVTSSSNRKTHTFSTWIKRCEFGDYHLIYTQGDNVGNEQFYMFFNNSDQIEMQQYDYPTNQGRLKTTQKFRDTSAWYHIIMRVDTTNSTADDRFRIYVNGEQITSFDLRTNPSQNLDTWINDTTFNFRIGATGYNGMKMDGYMADINFVDGLSLDPSSFGYTESQTGLWRPKRYEGTYGTNGFHLEFKDNSSTSALGKDTSGNGNDFTTNDFSVTDGKNYDSMIDTPTNNFPTLNPLHDDPYSSASYTAPTLRDGNLNYRTNTTSLNNYAESTMYFPRSGKWYIEIILSSVNIGSGVGYAQIDVAGYYLWWHYSSPYYEIQTVSGKQTIGSLSNNDIIQVAYDVDSGYIWYGKNNSWYLSGDPSSGIPMSPAAQTGNSDGSVKLFLNGRTGSAQNIMHVNFGQRPFNYTPPTGFKALCSKNLPPNVPSIIRPQKHFDTILYTGNGSSKTVSGLEFKPDLVWMKGRTSMNHAIVDSVRGRASVLFPNDTSAEQTSSSSQDLVEFNDHGFVVGTPYRASSSNNNGTNIVAWCWKAGGAAVTNTEGTITSQVSANTEAGFSIVSFTGNQTSGATVGHGLNAKPKWFIIKEIGNANDWVVYHESLGNSSGNTNVQFLNLTNDIGGGFAGGYNNTAPTSSVFSLGNSVETNRSGGNFIAYCWAEVPGFSKFGSYESNNNSDGPYVVLGFQPKWIMMKPFDSSGDWQIYDTSRTPLNKDDGNALYSNSNGAEASGFTMFDFLSNGFKVRNSGSGGINYSGTYIYMAFAEQPGTTAFETFPNAR